MDTVYDLNIICFACTTSNREKAKMGRSNTEGSNRKQPADERRRKSGTKYIPERRTERKRVGCDGRHRYMPGHNYVPAKVYGVSHMQTLGGNTTDSSF